MEYFRTEIKTGLMVTICLVILVSLTFLVGDAKKIGGTYRIKVLFKTIAGLDKDSPVNFAGLEVGRVKSIRVCNKKEKTRYPEYNISADLVVSSPVKIKTDSTIEIKTAGYLGQKYLDISPGSEKAEALKPGSVVLGTTPQDINEIIENIGSIIDEINPKIQRILDGIENIVKEDGLLPETISDLKGFIHNADEVVVVNKEDIRKIIVNLTDATDHLKEFASDIKSHPWKLLIKTPEKKKDKEKEAEKRGPGRRRKSFGPRR